MLGWNYIHEVRAIDEVGNVRVLTVVHGDAQRLISKSQVPNEVDAW